jgi:hypothetical protein
MRIFIRIFWVFSTFVFGIALIALGFVWVQGNMALPGELHRYFWEKLSWPWLPFEESSLVIRVILDESLACLFFLCTYLLNFSVKSSGHRQKLIPTQIRRSAQLSITGLLFFTVLSCWHHTGIIVWTIDGGGTLFSFLMNFIAVIYYLLVAAALFQLPAYNAGSKLQTGLIALGLEQLYSSSTEAERLNTPLKMQRISLVLLAGAMLFGIPMSLDRLLFAIPLLLLAIKTPGESQAT